MCFSEKPATTDLIADLILLFAMSTQRRLLKVIACFNFSLFPLLIKDGQVIPYFALVVFYLVAFFNAYGNLNLQDVKTTSEKVTTLLVRSFSFGDSFLICFTMKISFFLSIFQFVGSLMGTLFLSLAALIIAPPVRYPDIHALLNAVYSFVHFVIFTLYSHQQQFGLYEQRTTELDSFRLPSDTTIFTKLKVKQK